MVMIVIGMSNSKLLARDIARKLNVEYFDLDLRHSVDGEMHMKFSENVEGRRVLLVQSFYPHQNNALVEVLFAANHARDLNAKEIILVAPYLSYLREDVRKEKNECVSITILGEILSGAVDSIISVDPHVRDLNKHFSIPVYSVNAGELIKAYVKNNYNGVVVVGPDENSRNLVTGLGERFFVLDKKRKDEFNVKFSKGYNLENKKVVLIDDVAITGGTLIQAIKYLDLKDVDCFVIHPVFSGGALKELEKHANVISCNTIDNDSNKIDVSGIIARKIKDEWGS
ncbi:MAG: hypothetical protein CMH64_03710 [Nanoarchaeota archaeon]|nr:hypothetical protein [Nanoarchaeota archaeon]